MAFFNRPKTKIRTLYGWECACGSASDDGSLSRNHAEYLAERHQHRMGVDHAMPTITVIEREVPIDWP